MEILTSFIFSTASSLLSDVIFQMMNTQNKSVSYTELKKDVAKMVSEGLEDYQSKLSDIDKDVEKIKAEVFKEIETLALRDGNIELTDEKIELKSLSGIVLPFSKDVNEDQLKLDDRPAFEEWLTSFSKDVNEDQLKRLRIEVIKSQVKIALLKTTDLSPKSIENWILKGIQNQWIREVNVYGLNSDNLCKAQLMMKIDWDKHNLQIANGEAIVVITEDGRAWKNNTAVELSEMIKLFKDYVNANNLKAKCHTRYTTGENCEEANRILGLVQTNPIIWRSEAKGFEYDILEVSELRVGFYCVDNDDS